MTPTRPAVSLKAINFSLRISRRIGEPSATNSDDRQTGTQNCRMNSPMGVPRPTRTRVSFSAAEIMLVLLLPNVFFQMGVFYSTMTPTAAIFLIEALKAGLADSASTIGVSRNWFGG